MVTEYDDRMTVNQDLATRGYHGDQDGRISSETEFSLRKPPDYSAVIADYDIEGGVATFEYTASKGTSPTLAIIESITLVDGSDASDLPPLAYTIDPDLVERNFGCHPNGGDSPHQTLDQPSPILKLTFEYAEYAVTITQDEISVATGYQSNELVSRIDANWGAELK